MHRDLVSTTLVTVLALLPGCDCGGPNVVVDGGATPDAFLADAPAAPDVGAEDGGASDVGALDDTSRSDGGRPDAGACAGMPRVTFGSPFASVRVHSSDTDFEGIGDMVVASDGTIWAHDASGNGPSGDHVMRIDPDGSATVIASPTGWQFCYVSQLARDAAGDLFVFDATSNAMQRITEAGSVSAFAPTLALSGGGACTDTAVIGLAMGTGGDFWIASPVTDRIYTLSADGTTRTEVATVDEPWRIAEAPGGAIFVGSMTRIVEVSPSGATREVIDLAPLQPTGLEAEADGTIYFVSEGSVWQTNGAGEAPFAVAECFPSLLTDVEIGASTRGSSTSLYVSTIGSDGDVHDALDFVWELQR